LFAHYHPTDDLPPPPPPFTERGAVGAVAGQATLFHGVLDFLAALAAHRPLTVLLEDAHWQDAASLDLLRFLAREIATLPVLLLITYRGDELTRRHLLSQLLPLLVRESAVTRLTLHPLETRDLRTLARTRFALPDDDTARLIAYLDQRGAGNPFFIEELIQTLMEERLLRQDAGRWTLGDLTDAGVPSLLRHVIDGRVARLGEQAQALLAIAAVIGQDVPFALWAAVAGVDDTAITDVAERAEEARLMTGTTSGASMSFAHALVREALYEGLPSVRRRRWHRTIGDLLAATDVPDPDAVANHFQRAGDDRAVEWLFRAGLRALHITSFPIAIARFDAALAILDSAQTEDRSLRAWLLVGLAFAMMRRSPRQSIIYLQAAAQLAAQLGDAALDAIVCWTLGVMYCNDLDLVHGVPLLREGMAAVDALSAADRARITHVLGYSTDALRGAVIAYLASTGYLREAVRLGEERVPQSLDLQSGWYRGLLFAHTFLGQPARAAQAYRQTTAIERAADDYFHFGSSCAYYLATILTYHADDLVERQRVAAEGEWAWQQACAVIPDFQVPQFAWLPLLLVEGRWEELAQLIPLLKTPALTHQCVIASVMGPFARLRGDTAEAWRRVGEILPQGAATPPGGSGIDATLAMQRLAGAMAIDAGDLSHAREWLEAHDRWLSWSEAVLGQAEGQLLWAAYWRAAGDRAQTQACAERALAHATAPRQPLALLAAHRLLGELDTEAGRYEPAATHLDASLHMATACRAPYERALTLLALAELHAATGNRREALMVCDDARTILTPLAATLALTRVDTLTERLTAIPDTPATFPDSLSAREVEVLRLIASGRNNQEIADTLSISVRTVERHITNSYGKIAARSRADAAVYVLHHLT
jgi:DNA-binding CsgD family transcriptional regulator